MLHAEFLEAQKVILATDSWIMDYGWELRRDDEASISRGGYNYIYRSTNTELPLGCYNSLFRVSKQNSPGYV